jgi:hypothetical protein
VDYADRERDHSSHFHLGVPGLRRNGTKRGHLRDSTGVTILDVCVRGQGPCEPTRSFVTDISKLIVGFQNDGHTIHLSLDANEASGLQSGVDRIMRQSNFLDAHSLCSSDPRPMPATYQRGSTKIDFVLISPRLVDAVIGVSILPLHDGYTSDHRALLVDYDASLLFGGPTSPIVAPLERRLASTNPRAVHAYTDHMKSHFETHGILKKLLLSVRNLLKANGLSKCNSNGKP